MRQSYLDELQGLLRRIRRRWLTERSMRALGRAGAGASAMVILVLSADYFLQPGDLPLVLMATSATLALMAFILWALWPLRRVPSARQVARFIEERCPELEDRLASATALDERQPVTPFHDLMLADAVARTRALDVARVVPPDDFRRSVLRGALAAAALLLVLAIGSGSIGRMARVTWLYALPFTMSIDVEPGDARIMTGQPLVVRARLGESAVASLRTPPRLLLSLPAGPQTIEMQPTQAGYEARLEAVTDSFTYRVTAATVTTDDFSVVALVEPNVRQIDVSYVYPEFTGLLPRVEQDSGDVFAPAGTRVTLRVVADKPVVSGAIVMEDGGMFDLTSRAGNALETSFDVRGNGSYRVTLVDADGVNNPGRTEYFIRTSIDQVPEIRITRPDGDREVTPLEEVVIEARADDDYGIDRLELVYSVVGQGERAISLGSGRAPTMAGGHTIFAEDLDVQPGDFITYYARARDAARGASAGEVRSDIFFLEVRPFDQEFEASQSQGPMAQDLADVANLANVQKEIIVATWKLDRMAADKDDADDIKAVAGAQGELKDTAQEVAERVQSRGRASTADARGQRNPENDSMRAAVEAMAEAQTELDALSTAGSLPHEMEALNQLLKAQAEIRRKQVAMSQGEQGGSAGMSQAAEDLSQLFDRELRREQQTNYENLAQSGAEQSDESEALKKVRELAARQQQLKDEQDALAAKQAALSEEELQRSLEELTREQNELRRQLEELSRQMAAMRRGEEGKESTSEIAERMQRAMNELRRQDPSQASAQSDQALQGLRDLEQQLQGDEERARQEEVARLQADAQQLAEEQRRLAAATRAAPTDTRGRDTRYELAGQEDQLAERVDALEHGIEDVEAKSTARDREPLEAARQELQRGAVGRTMRGLGDRLRQTIAGDASATPEELTAIAQEDERMAEILDRVANQIQAAGRPPDESQRLSQQLQQAQQLRQSLSELEQKFQQQGESGGSPPPEIDPSMAQDRRPGGELQEVGADRQYGQEGRPDDADERGQAGEAASVEDLLAQIKESPELMDELRRDNPDIEQDLESWAQYWASRSAPGTEPEKQDFTSWESLRRDIRLALESFEVSRSQQLLETQTQDRVNAGTDERMPEAYRRLVEKYYEALAARPR